MIEELLRYVSPRNDQPYEDLLAQMEDGKNQASAKERLSPKQEAFLASVGRFPCLDRKSRQQKLGWGAQTMQNVIDSLEGTYIQPCSIRKGGRGSSYITYQLMDQARKYMREHGIHVTKIHGSLQHHCTIERWMHTRREEGYKVVRQPQLGEFQVDALAKGDSWIACEVVASDNVHRDREKVASLMEYVQWLEIICLGDDLEEAYRRGVVAQQAASIQERIELSRV